VHRPDGAFEALGFARSRLVVDAVGRQDLRERLGVAPTIEREWIWSIM